MALSHFSQSRLRPSLAFALLAVFLLILFVAGGASRADAAGQAMVRLGAWVTIVAVALFLRPRFAEMPAPWLFLIGAIVIGLLQLVPLPPALWTILPGRSTIMEPSIVTMTWRPLAIVPGTTMNAVHALVVPAAVLLLMASLRAEERGGVLSLVMVLTCFSLLLGLLQFSGAGLDNPLINDTPGEVGGPFANRNHFALWLAMACMAAPVWAFSNRKRSRWLAPVGLSISILSLLTILATGSRAGILLGGLALILGLLLVKRDLQRMLQRYPRWVFFAVTAGAIVIIVAFLLLSVAVDRAVAINRLLAADPGQDMRSRGLPTVLAAIASYFPFGSGLGGFDPVFRLNEPFALLKPTYFNHAHNDFLEIILDTGIVGGVLLASGLAWWARASVTAWRRGNRLSRLGSAIMLLVIVASLVDYPIRTPLMLMLVTIAAAWLSDRSKLDNGSALPRASQHL